MRTILEMPASDSMRTRRNVLGRMAALSLTPLLSFPMIAAGLLGQAHAASLPKGWKKANAQMAHNLASLYVQGKHGWFDEGRAAGGQLSNHETGQSFDFVQHGSHSKKWLLARSEHFRSYFLVFRGTQENRIEDIAADLSGDPVLLPKHLGGNSTIVLDPTAYGVPAGFLLYWNQLSREIDELALPHLRTAGWRLRVSGFSLGGVFALYAAWYLQQVKNVRSISSVYTFGAPGSTNLPFSIALGKGLKPLFRVIAADDPVPGLKPKWFHAGTTIGLGLVGGGGHSIEKYRDRIATY